MDIRKWRFRRAVRQALANRHHTAVLMIDVFRPDGETVPAEFTRVLRACVPRPGRTWRLDEGRFAVLLPGLAFPEQAYDVAGLIASALSPVIVGGRLRPLTAAIGVAVAPPGELTGDLAGDELTDRAGQAMLRARRRGPQTRWAVWQEVTRRDAA
ncbi:GGDEF domain-containing protein [Actinoplanes sp. M2I2]|uniref:GGDEF domain-containing protein n=1 Tax=Actinoplanes sp. M2I2 TaxID=1734444 RepID=UPI002021A161|nr:GGDEF domain-containing protein [Actinoplanes sp. M2I2]